MNRGKVKCLFVLFVVVFFVWRLSDRKIGSRSLNENQSTRGDVFNHHDLRPTSKRHPFSAGDTMRPSLVTARVADQGSASPALTEILVDFVDAKDNIFYDEPSWIEQVLQNVPKIIEHIGELLQAEASLSEMPPTELFLTESPEAVLARMAALDLLKAVLASGTDEAPKEQAVELLVQIAGATPKAWDLSDSQQRNKGKVVESERYEALEILAQWSPAEALEAFGSLEHTPAAVEWLRPALFEGLVSTGMPSDQAWSLILDARPISKL